MRIGVVWSNGRLVRKLVLFTAFMVFFTVLVVMRGFDVAPQDDFPLRDTARHQSAKEPRKSYLQAPFGLELPLLGRFFAQSTISPTELKNDLSAGFHRSRWYLPADHAKISYNRVDMEDLRKLWPEQSSLCDRIESQLLYNADLSTSESGSSVKPGISGDIPFPVKLKTIFLPEGTGAWGAAQGRNWFLENHCPVNTCQLTGDSSAMERADAVLVKSAQHRQRPANRSDQIWIMYQLESPKHTSSFEWAKNVFNWTATYRMDSDIVAPYEKFVLYDPAVRQTEQPVNYAAMKRGKGKVAWFVSNCAAHNNRLEYAKELSQYISVDIYGSCGDKRCSRRDNNCEEMLKTDYKFYLAFENSNCRWYITEKFWVNALRSLTIPIVMGAPLDDYQLLAPLKSFIHVDQFPQGPRALAEYLHQLDGNDTLYNEYFRWRGTGQLINTFFFCRLCAMLHAKGPAKTHANLDEWWRGPGICRR